MRELILITLLGRDNPSVIASISEILSDSNAHILDIGQAVIHENLSLGILIEIPSGQDASSVVKNVLYRAHEMDMQVQFQSLDRESYDAWAGLQGEPKHIVTLLARQITAEHISALTCAMAEMGLHIDAINRLSARKDLDGDTQSNSCVEFTTKGVPSDVSILRAKFAELATNLGVDIVLQEDDMYRRTRRLVCFDMDSTLIEAEVIDELAKVGGVGDEVIAITEAAMRGELDFKQSFAKRMRLLQGLDESVLEDIANNLPITEGAEKLISTLKKLGYKTAILSGGFDYFGQYLKARLGIDYVFANELDIVDGKVTGNVTGDIVDGQRKAELLRTLAAKEMISLNQVVAVGDGANDLPMLSVAGLGIAFRAKPLVRAEAKHVLSHLGLDAILYLLGLRDQDLHE